MAALFSLKDVSTPILHNLSLDVKTGNFLTLIGPSGAGKSSLLFLLNRLNDPADGEIFYLDKPLDEYPITVLRRKVGMVFQSANLFPGTVRDNLKYGPSLSGSWSDGKASRLLQQVRLPNDLLDRDVDRLSGGEKQRVAMARTLANEPEVLLLDEPTSALDERTTEAIEEVLMELQQKNGTTIIMVTHDLEQAERLGNRTVFLENGRILEEGLTAELFTSPRSERLKSFLYGNGD
ncbi:ABC transporter ATP-binding protein [Bacillus marinisedimentorum]|uniref:ABC transporter ATP-binding protein n=1 Tax=Bacillus marinisedimentorum TaxID=1821260 RepID=UPI0008720D01|nr:phosphate ABC transporter ATP-binding protein [Bacillus marinisedimentorum]